MFASRLKILVALTLLTAALPNVYRACADVMPPAEEGNVKVNDVWLHAKVQGVGNPVIFIGGVGANYQEWDPYVTALAPTCEVMSYSRRYDWPNVNKFKVSDDPLGDDVDDLYHLMRVKKIWKANLVAHSYGALVALAFAVKHPNMVTGLVLAEPTLNRWESEDTQTLASWQSFVDGVYVPIKGDVLSGKTETAFRKYLDALRAGQYEATATGDLPALYASAGDLKSLFLSTGGYPTVPQSSVAKIKVPILILVGERSDPDIVSISRTLSRVAGGAPISTIAAADHFMITEQPQSVINAVAEFVGERGGK